MHAQVEPRVRRDNGEHRQRDDRWPTPARTSQDGTNANRERGNEGDVTARKAQRLLLHGPVEGGARARFGNQKLDDRGQQPAKADHEYDAERRHPPAPEGDRDSEQNEDDGDNGRLVETIEQLGQGMRNRILAIVQ